MLTRGELSGRWWFTHDQAKGMVSVQRCGWEGIRWSVDAWIRVKHVFWTGKLSSLACSRVVFDHIEIDTT